MSEASATLPVEVPEPQTADTAPVDTSEPPTADTASADAPEPQAEDTSPLTTNAKRKSSESPAQAEDISQTSNTASPAKKQNRNQSPKKRESSGKRDENDGTLTEVGGEARRIKSRLEATVKRDAARQLVRLRSSNGGKARSGDIEKVVDMYQRLGYSFITKGTLAYQASALKKNVKKAKSSWNAAPTIRDAIAGKDKKRETKKAAGNQKKLLASGTSDNAGETTDTSNLKSSTSSLKKPPTGQNIPRSITLDTPVESEGPPKPRNKGGRPKGSMKSTLTKRVKAKRLSSVAEHDKLLFEVTTKAAALYLAEREKAEAPKEPTGGEQGKTTKSVPNGTMHKIITAIEKEYNLPPKTINARTVLSRVIRKNPTGHCSQRTPLLAEMEPFVRDYCAQLAASGCYLSKAQVLLIAESFINRSPELAQRLLDEKKKRKMIFDDDENKNNEDQKDDDDDDDDEKEKGKSTAVQSLIGVRWFYGFKRRHFEEITRLAGNELRYVSRHFLLRLEHFKSMYDMVYEKMVEAKVAERSNRPALYDIDGNRIQTANREWAYGLPTRYKVTKPEYILFLDQVGTRSTYKEQQLLIKQNTSTTSLRDDDDEGENKDKANKDRSGLAFYNHIEGQIFDLPVDCTNTGTGEETTKMQFSVYCITDGNGEPVVCAVVLMSDKHVNEIPLTVRWGIDMYKPLHEGPTELELFDRNCRPGQAMQGGPICNYHGHEIPCFVGTSPTGTMNGTVLLDMCKYLDQIKLFDRSNANEARPFLLLDGHSTLIDLPFLDYAKGEGHEWTVCVGLPKGCHLIQVADASEFNGSFKSAWYQSKERLLNTRLHHTGRKYFYPSDIMPLIHHAWCNSAFAGNARYTDDDDDGDTHKHLKGALKKALALRGWNPLNYALLLHPVLNKKQQLSEPSTKKKPAVQAVVATAPIAFASPESSTNPELDSA